MTAATSGTSFSYTEEYEVGSGTIDLGRSYEYKMVALISLRCLLQDFDDIRIAFNAAGLGALDDVIVNAHRKDGDSIKILLQLKHEERGKDIVREQFLAPKGNYSLFKYYEHIVKLKERLDCKSDQKGIVKDLKTFNNMYFVLFTNKGTNKSEFIEKGACRPISFLNTSNKNDSVYEFDYTKVSTLVGLSSLDYKINFSLFVKQSHANHLEEIIENEIKNVFRYFGLTDINTESISEKFIKYVTDWCMGKLGKHYYLTKQDLLYKLTELSLSQYELDLSREKFQSYDCRKKQLWNKVVGDKLITVVDTDEEIMKFLKLYIGSEISPYYHEFGRSWSCKFSRQEQSLFYEQHANLKKAMLKIVGNNGRITLLSIYKCLWFNEHLPLLLKIKNLEDYDVILKILKLSNYKLRVVTLSKTKIIPTTMIGTPGYFATLCDLNNEKRLKILNNSIKLQGRSSVVLKELIDDSLFRHINCNAIIKILLDKFNVATEYEPLSEYFVSRSLLKVFLNIDVIKQVNDETFVIETVDDSSSKELHELISTNTTKANIIIDSDNILTQTEKLNLRRKPIHRVIFRGKNLLEWKESFGTTRNIRKYHIDFNTYMNEIVCSPHNTNWVCNELEHILAKNVFNGVYLVSASPGMGKSTLIDYIACKASTKLWVLNIKLIDHDDYYDNITSIKETLTAHDHLKYFNDSILEKGDCSNNELARAVFQKFLTANKVLVMLDGLDEISISCKNEVLEIAQSIQKSGFSIWLTTRPHLRTDAEDKFGTIATTLRPFSVHDQTRFLKRYFKHISDTVKINKENHQTLINEFVEKLLQASRDNLNDMGGEFMGIPLQTKLLANAFSNELKQLLSTGIVECEYNFDLLHLYEEFMKKKDNILRDRFGKGAKDMKILFQKHQQLFALNIVFSDNVLYRLDFDQQLDNYYKNNEDHIQFLQQDGVTIIYRYVIGTIKKFQVSFVHRTFAEYMAALWLFNNFNSDSEDLGWTARFVLQQRRMYTNYGLLFRMFDSMLARHSQLHMLIINGRIGGAQKLVTSHPEVMDDIDEGGRSFLHMVALYGAVHQGGYFVVGPKVEGIINFIEQIPKCKMVNMKDKLGYSPLDYALLNNSFAIGTKLCEKTKELTISTDILRIYTMYRENEWLHFQTYRTLIKTLLPCIICQCLFLDFHSINLDTTIESYCYKIFSVRENGIEIINDYTNELGITTISDFLTKTNIKSGTECYYYDLRFAAAFGTSLNVLDLILSEYATVDQPSFTNFNTPLYWAVKYDRLEIVSILLYYGENPNELCKGGETALHCAAENGYTAIVRQLLSHKANVNIQNDTGETPLFMAAWNKHTNVAKLLLFNHAKVTIKNSFHSFPIHYAAKNGLDDIILNLLKDIDINYPNFNNETPLHVAISNRHLSTARLLLLNGADCNIPNRNNELLLHTVAQEGLYEVLPEIFSKTKSISLNASAHSSFTCVQNEAVNIKNKKGQTALHLSLYGTKFDFYTRSSDRVKIVNFFLKHGANSNSQDNGGNNALHYLCEGCPLDPDDRKSAAKLLLDKGVDVNLKNSDGKTPLHLFLRYIFLQDKLRYLIDTVSLFLSYEVNVNVQDSDGNTVLHYLCEEGRINKDDRKYAASLLLNKGANVNLKNNDGDTPLHLFLHYLYLKHNARDLFEIVPLLLSKECNVNTQNINGNTALHCLCQNSLVNEENRKSAVVLLLDKGADVNLRNELGESALTLAIHCNFADIISLFQETLPNDNNY